MTQNDLVQKIQQFFSHEIEKNTSLNDAAKESLTVAIECIEQTYNIQRGPPSSELSDIFNAHSSNQGQQNTGRQPDPSQLLNNLASTLFSSVGRTQPSATSTAAPTETTTAPRAQTTRKQATEAERMAAESFKNQGNDSMKQEKFREAYDYYTQAIEIDNNNAIYYSNRAAASSKLGDHQAALCDCQEAIDIDPNYSKAYGRMGLAYASLENHSEAKKAYVKAVELDPTNESYQNNLNIAEEKLAERQNGGLPGSGSAGANVMGMLQSMMTNPQVMSLAMQSLQDPRIQGMFGLGGSATGGQQQQTSNTEAQQQSATRPPQQQQAENNQQRSPSSGESQGEATAGQTDDGQQQQPAFNPADLLNLTSRIAGNANIDLVGAGQQLLSSIQQNNPDLVDNMRRMMSQAFMNPNGPGGGRGNQDGRNPPPGYS